MSKFKDTYRIESTRLPEYDYSRGGYYFVTVCTHNRQNLFGRIEKGHMVLNEAGKIVEKCWLDLPNHYPNLNLDYYCILPNHLHLIMIIDNPVSVETGLRPVSIGNIVVNTETGLRPVSTIQSKFHGIPEFIRALKSFSSRRIHEQRQSKYPPIWQKNYYEHIIRNEKSLYEIRKYIQNNPLDWEDDEYYNH
jgi:REP element-mobilizing transposase RayT